MNPLRALADPAANPLPSTAPQKLGGEDVISITLPEKLDTIGEFVLASGRSGRQIRKMADAVVQAVSD